MKRQETDLIVLHTTKYSENSLVVHALSPVYGRCGIFVNGVNRGRKASLFQPLAILDAVVGESPKSSLLTLGEAVPKHNLALLRSDHIKSILAVFICEVLYRTIRDGVAEEGLFEWVERMILLLDSMEGEISNFHIYFMIGLCARLGFSPRNNYSESNPRFSMTAAEFSDSGILFPEEDSLLLHQCLSSDFAGCMTLKTSGYRRRSLLARMVDYLGYHSDTNLDIKSLDILHDVLC